MLAPRAAYARGEPVSVSYILYYVLFFSALIAVTAGVSATGRVTLTLLISLAVSWMFVPLLHVVIAAGLVASARAPRVGGRRAVALLLMGHAPWSLWVLSAAVLSAVCGYPGYRAAVLLALVPIALTFRIVHAFCLDVLRTSPRGALCRTLAHQAVTGVIAVVYLEKAVGLLPRIYGWLS